MFISSLPMKFLAAKVLLAMTNLSEVEIEEGPPGFNTSICIFSHPHDETGRTEDSTSTGVLEQYHAFNSECTSQHAVHLKCDTLLSLS